MCKCLNHPKFHSQWSRHRIVPWNLFNVVKEKAAKTPAILAFEGKCSFSTAFDHSWNQYKAQKSRNKKATWWELGAGLWRNLTSLCSRVSLMWIFSAWNLCLFFVRLKCRHWILVEDHVIHIYSIHVYINIYTDTHCEDAQYVSPVWVILFESCCLDFGNSATAGRRMVQTGATCCAASRVVFVKASCLMAHPFLGWCHCRGFWFGNLMSHRTHVLHEKKTCHAWRNSREQSSCCILFHDMDNLWTCCKAP